MHLTHFVNSGQLACCIAQEGILFGKDPLGSGSSSFRVLPQRHHPVY